MRKSLTLVATLLLFTAGCSMLRTANSQGRKSEVGVITGDPAKAVEVMKELRHKLLTSRPGDVLSGEDAEAQVWGVLVDVASAPGVVTLVSLRDGTSSIYTTTGNGILGGYAAREEARACVLAAEQHLKGMRPADSFPYPEAGRVKFYVLTRDGVLTAEAGLKELTERRDELWPLFYKADKVLTQLHRVADEKRRQQP